MTATINSRADLERLRDTPAFEPALLALYGTTTIWSLAEGQWVALEDLTAINRLGYTKAIFLEEIEPFEFPAPVAPPLPPSDEVDPLTRTLTKRQIVRAMIVGASISDPETFVETAIEAMTDPQAKALALADWRYAPYYIRTHDLFSNPQILTATGMTSQQIDGLWAVGVEQPA